MNELYLIGLTKLTTDEVIRDDETRLQKKGSTSAYATDKDIWTIQCHNNILDNYKTNCTNRWRYIKTPLQSRRRYLKETLTPQQLESKARYIKPSTLPWKGTKNINLKKRETIKHSWLFHIYSIILFWLWHWRCCGRHHTGNHP